MTAGPNFTAKGSRMSALFLVKASRGIRIGPERLVHTLQKCYIRYVRFLFIGPSMYEPHHCTTCPIRSLSSGNHLRPKRRRANWFLCGLWFLPLTLSTMFWCGILSRTYIPMDCHLQTTFVRSEVLESTTYMSLGGERPEIKIGN